MQQQNNIEENKALYHFIKQHCIFDDEFILSSGKKATRYFDLRLLTLDGRYGRVLAQAMKNKLSKYNIHLDNFDCIGGMEAGAIPIVSTLVNTWGKFGFYVRKTPRDHGTMRNIEGWSAMYKNAKYLLVDDVVTTGMTMVKVQEALDKKQPVAMICIIDRMIEQPLGLISLFRESDFEF